MNDVRGSRANVLQPSVLQPSVLQPRVNTSTSASVLQPRVLQPSVNTSTSASVLQPSVLGRRISVLQGEGRWEKSRCLAYAAEVELGARRAARDDFSKDGRIGSAGAD